MKGRIDWVLVVQVFAICNATLAAPYGWKGVVFWSLILISATCGPEYPWGKQANGGQTTGREG